MTKEITLNGTEYVLYVHTLKLFRLKNSGLPCAGMVRSLVKTGSREFNRVLAAFQAA